MCRGESQALPRPCNKIVRVVAIGLHRMDGVTEHKAPDQTVQSVSRAIHILDLLADQESLGVTEISKSLGVHRSTAFRLLATLEAHNYVEQESHRGTYRLSFGVLRLSGQVGARVDIVKEAEVVCNEVVDELNETSNVAIHDEGAAVNICQAMGTRLVSVTRQYVGQRTPLHATSTGKILLAFSPRQNDMLPSGRLEAFTPHTITNLTVLAKHLEQVRSQGWAGADQEWELDTNAVAVPVRNATGAVIAALSVTAPSFRMTPEEFGPLAEVLQRHAEHLGARLGAVAP